MKCPNCNQVKDEMEACICDIVVANSERICSDADLKRFKKEVDLLSIPGTRVQTLVEVDTLRALIGRLESAGG